MVPRTKIEIGEHLPRDLVNVAVQFFAARARDEFSVGRAGEGESCLDAQQFINGAACAGHIALLKRAANRSNVLCQACFNGHMHVVNYDISRFGLSNANDALFQACLGGQLRAAERMIACGATELDAALEAACASDSMEIVRLLVQKGATRVDNGFSIACQNGNLEMVEYLLTSGFAEVWFGVFVAASRKRLNILGVLARFGPENLNKALSHACRRGNVYCASTLAAAGATHCTHCGQTHALN